MGESAEERAERVGAAEERRRQIVFVCEHGWAGVRLEAAKLLSRGGLAPLVEAAVLVGESEMRGQIPETDRLPEQIWERLGHAGHPLGWVPARRMEMEQGLGVWEYRSDGTGSCRGRTPAAGEALPDGPMVEVRRVVDAGPGALAAFESIMGASNGRAMVVEIELAGSTGASRGLAAAIGEAFEPLRARKRHTTPSTVLVPGEDVVLAMLGIAVTGGAYDEGRGVLGRLGVWRTLAALVGAGAGEGFEEVYHRVRGGPWLRFETGGCEWFENVVWDGCYAYLSPSWVRAGVVAWTDTD